MQNVIILTGPTAAGKTALSVRLAKEIGGEIISADSMQVYRGLDIGTAKVRPDEMEGVPHHLIDVLDPKEECNVYRFAQMAREAIGEIASHGRLPILVGGTGFYIRALLYDCAFEEEDMNAGDALTRQYEALAKEQGTAYLHQLLRERDPASAEAIHAHNVKRVIRALVYQELNGRPISAHNAENRRRESPYRFAYFVLNLPREQLYARIDARVDQMVEDGLIDEVKRCRAMGLSAQDSSMQAIGYRQILSVLEMNEKDDGTTQTNAQNLQDAISAIKTDTRHFAKRQLTWFRREQETVWIEETQFPTEDEKLAYILAVLKEKGIWEANQ